MGRGFVAVTIDSTLCPACSATTRVGYLSNLNGGSPMCFEPVTPGSKNRLTQGENSEKIEVRPGKCCLPERTKWNFPYPQKRNHEPPSTVKVPMTKPRISTGIKVAALFWPEFAVVKGGVLLKEVAAAEVDTRFRTRTEFDENHIHILDHFTHGARIRREPFFNTRHPDFIEASNLGRKICFTWAHKLRQDFPRWHFRVYFHGLDPIVRFHRVRPHEEPEIRDIDWREEIKSGEVLIVDTRRMNT